MRSKKIKEKITCPLVREEDLVEKFIYGTGSGGQKINKTASTVYIRHIPTGIEIKCQQSRSREQNRITARIALSERLEKIERQKILAKQKELAKLRRQKHRRSPLQKQKLLEEKRKTSQKKTLRQKPKVANDE